MRGALETIENENARWQSWHASAPMRKIDIGAAPLAPGCTGERIALETAKRSAARGGDVPNTPRVNQQRPMNWRFDDILTFISVIEAGSVTSAATRLNLFRHDRRNASVVWRFCSV